jgi:hypothetical protein
MTTYESLRGYQVPALRIKVDNNPFPSEGIAHNIIVFWMGLPSRLYRIAAASRTTTPSAL